MDETSSGWRPSATATDGLVVSSPWRQGAGRVHDPGPANLRAARQEHQVAARESAWQETAIRNSRNFGPGRTTLQLGASPMPWMNAVALATVEGGLNMRRCVTTRMNSPFRRIKYL